MKTNVVLSSPDRKLFGIQIRQETKTGFLNLSDLQEAYIVARIQNGWSKKGEIQNILSQKENCERIFFILKKRNYINLDFSKFMDIVDKYGLIKTLKHFKVYKTTGRGSNRTIWCSTDIFVLTAIELNAALYAEVIIWITDKLIINRIEAGNFYKGLSRAVTKFTNVDYVKLAKTLNYKIFGKHETGIRNLATKEELQRLFQLENNLTFAIDMGYIKSFDECINAILES